MSYSKIPNLYKNQEILMFKECWAMEKIHGTSAHISWNEGEVRFFSGGAKYENFIKLFDEESLCKKFIEYGEPKIIIHGEAYGGKMQGMSNTYGKELKFIAFDVKIDGNWLNVPDADSIVTGLFGLEFVHYQKTSCDISLLDKLRDAGSIQAQRNGIEEFKKAEGIVLRPLIEVRKNNDARICAKHKRDDYCERRTPQEVSEEKLKILADAEEIAEEWVTENRLDNILSHLNKEPELSDIPEICKRIVVDVQIEGKDEIVESKLARKAIARRAIKLFKKRIMTIEPDDAKGRFVRGVLTFQDNQPTWNVENVKLKDYQSIRPKHYSNDPISPGDENE